MKVSVDSKSIEVLLREVEQNFDSKKINRAVALGMNKAGVGIRAQITKGIRQTVSIKASVFKEGVKMVRAKPSDNPTVNLVINNDPIPLINFVTAASLRQLQAGKHLRGRPPMVRVKVLKAKPPVAVPKGFYVAGYGRPSHGGTASGAIMKRVGKERGPLKMMFGPALGNQAEKVLESVLPEAREIIERRVRESINYQLLKSQARGG